MVISKVVGALFKIPLTNILGGIGAAGYQHHQLPVPVRQRLQKGAFHPVAERQVDDVIRTLAEAGIAEIYGGLVGGNDLGQLIGDILHAVGAECVLSTHLPAGAGKVL